MPPPNVPDSSIDITAGVITFYIVSAFLILLTLTWWARLIFCAIVHRHLTAIEVFKFVVLSLTLLGVGCFIGYIFWPL